VLNLHVLRRNQVGTRDLLNYPVQLSKVPWEPVVICVK
jgi:hypothetical protein